MTPIVYRRIAFGQLQHDDSPLAQGDGSDA
jgi:hypothetical protein